MGNEAMDTSADGAKAVLYRCFYCSHHIDASMTATVFTHLQLHIEYQGVDRDEMYRCPIEDCPEQRETPDDLTTHMLDKHATRRKVSPGTSAHLKAIRFGIRTQEKLLEMTQDIPADSTTLLHSGERRPDNRRFH